MNRINKLFAIGLLTMVCSANAAFAAPVPQKNDPDSVTVTETKQTEMASEKATAKATSKATAKASEKATAKATSKAASKATAKASEKATAKSTSKATEKTSSSSKSSESPSEDNDKIVLDPSKSSEDVLVVSTTPEPSLSVQNGGAQLENSKYLTKGAFAFWFIFGLIIGAVISFAVSYRFYKMSRRDNHVMSELRALKRDIDSKMLSTVGGFSEYDVQMSNSNPSYASPDKPIKAEYDEQNDEKSEEIYRKWETQINKTKESAASDEPQVRRVNRPVTDAPRRRPTDVKKRRSSSKKNGVTDKIKGMIGDMFPFDK